MFFFSACNQLPKDNSKLSLKYLGAAGWEINDENSTVLVDPYLSRVKLVGNSTTKSISTSALNRDWGDDDRKKFDIDLEYGKVREKQVADMLQDKKIEVKSERGMWQKTGNIAIEYESYGKPSGIAATESDYWFHNLCIDDETFCTLVFKTDSLKKIIDNLDYKRSVSLEKKEKNKFLWKVKSLNQN